MDVLEELTEERVDRAYVERRVDGWLAAIEAFHADVVAWLPQGWRGRKSGTVPMHEELMQRFGMPERHLPVLQLERNGDLQGRVEPRGLWIIGANGRIDLILPPRHFLIVNREDSSEPPRWMIASILERREQKPFDRTVLNELLA